MPKVIDSCPPCSFPCCCCTPCGLCLPEYLYFKILTVTGTGSANWTWMVNATAVFRGASRDREDTTCQGNCEQFAFVGMLSGSTINPPQCTSFFNTEVGCSAGSVFSLSRIYPFSDPHNGCGGIDGRLQCWCDPDGDAVAGIGNDGLVFGTDEPCDLTCYDSGGLSLRNNCNCLPCFDVDGVMFGITVNIGNVGDGGLANGEVSGFCYCSKYEAAADETKCDDYNPDSPQMIICLTKTYCNPGRFCTDYQRFAMSCIPRGGDVEIPCPITPPAFDHRIVWDSVICDEDTGAFISQSFTATFQDENSCCASDDGTVVITGILYA